MSVVQQCVRYDIKCQSFNSVIVIFVTDIINMTHASDPKFKPVTGKQCRSKVATDAGDGKNKVHLNRRIFYKHV